MQFKELCLYYDYSPVVKDPDRQTNCDCATVCSADYVLFLMNQKKVKEKVRQNHSFE
jgi:hypothetical protein